MSHCQAATHEGGGKPGDLPGGEHPGLTDKFSDLRKTSVNDREEFSDTTSIQSKQIEGQFTVTSR
jgi:hypothetical protein